MNSARAQNRLDIHTPSLLDWSRIAALSRLTDMNLMGVFHRQDAGATQQKEF